MYMSDVCTSFHGAALHISQMLAIAHCSEHNTPRAPTDSPCTIRRGVALRAGNSVADHVCVAVGLACGRSRKARKQRPHDRQRERKRCRQSPPPSRWCRRKVPAADAKAPRRRRSDDSEQVAACNEQFHTPQRSQCAARSLMLCGGGEGIGMGAAGGEGHQAALFCAQAANTAPPCADGGIPFLLNARQLTLQTSFLERANRAPSVASHEDRPWFPAVVSIVEIFDKSVTTRVQSQRRSAERVKRVDERAKRVGEESGRREWCGSNRWRNAASPRRTMCTSLLATMMVVASASSIDERLKDLEGKVEKLQLEGSPRMSPPTDGAECEETCACLKRDLAATRKMVVVVQV